MYRSLPVILVATGILCLSMASLHAQQHVNRGLLPARYEPSFNKLRDTLYLLDTTYVEVRLDKQVIYQHFRSGRVDTYSCSTGDPRIPDGISTRAGIFTIQGKAKRTLSQQFQVYLNYWMQFDGGIGFHGLDTRSYYRYLGQRPSSHGCVRISNETGARLFGNVHSGTVVFVHSGSPARILRFADDSVADLQSIYDIDIELLKRRLDAVAIGNWSDPSLNVRIGIPARRKLDGKIAIGSVNPDLIVQYPIKLINYPALATPAGPAPRIVPAAPLLSFSGTSTEEKAQ
jgi:hypothetical protein